jgi:hypothetical protein
MKPYLLVLENFQSLQERAEIPISPLTFLYGPNSAGKSCIDDALHLLSAVFVGGASESATNHRALLKRWSHRSSVRDGETLEQKGITRLELHGQVGRIFEGSSATSAFSDIVDAVGGLNGWFNRSGWNIVLGLEGDSAGWTSITFSCGSECVFRTIWTEEGIDLELSLKAFGSTFSALADKHFVDLKKRQKLYKLECEMVLDPTPVLSFYKGDEMDRDVIAVVNALLQDLKKLNIAPANLGADRSTIGSTALSAICGGAQQYLGRWSSTGVPSNFYQAQEVHLEFARNSEFPFMNALARSNYEWIYCERNPNPVDVGGIQDPKILNAIDTIVAWNFDMRPEVHEGLHLFVNRCLRDHLFLDQGYQLVYEALEIKPATNIDAPPLTAALMIGSLVDKSGRRMTFEDVGTGISCVIPVLVAVHTGCGFIQQPELHLHPALQSALGDVFAEATKVLGSYHFIETHSEYILLRCLRRVRETTAGNHPAGSPLALKPEDLSVLYFEPLPDGSTRVKKIRVSTQGDFIDRWPRGFFEERGKELFDE